MIKRYTLKLLFIVSITLFLPVPILAQNTIVGYGYGKKWIQELEEYPLAGFPTNAQLERLTHVIASDIGCFGDGSLFAGKLPNDWEWQQKPMVGKSCKQGTCERGKCKLQH